MPYQSDEQRRRPPPIQIPPVPQGMSMRSELQSKNSGQQHRDTRNAPTLTQPRPLPVVTPLTSPIEPGSRHTSRTGSERCNRGTAAMDVLAYLMEQAGITSRNADAVSVLGSHLSSTTRSRHSGLSQQSTSVTQAQTNSFDENETTSRGRIESRKEQTRSKGQGQATIHVSSTSPADEVHIEVLDLRPQCRVASGERKVDHEEPAKSPKKRFMGMSFPALSLSASKKTVNGTKTAMPSKFAQVVGEEPRTVRHIPVRPIKPPGPFTTPTKAPRSDTSSSLPAKIQGQDRYAYRHHSTTARRQRAASRKSPPRTTTQSSDAENVPPVPVFQRSFESTSPPTPPAKDTPPDIRAAVQPGSPLRRTAPSDCLRSNYESLINAEHTLRFPAFALSPSPPKVDNPDSVVKSPNKAGTCTADDFKKMLASLEQSFLPLEHHSDAFKIPNIRDSPSVASEEAIMSPLPHSEGESDKMRYSSRLMGEMPRASQLLDHGSYHSSRRLDSLQPRFYSPSARSYSPFADGESPSKNSDHGRLLCTVNSPAEQLSVRETEHNDQIDMIFQGNVNEINPNSSTGQLLKDRAMEDTEKMANGDTVPKIQVAQGLQFGEQQERRQQLHGSSGHLQPDASASELTDLLNRLSPHRVGVNDDFNCSSAVPSPLHGMPAPDVPVPSMMGPNGSVTPWTLPPTPKSIEYQFFMINEHLDVVGKTTWDAIATLKEELYTGLPDRNKQLMLNVEKRIGEIGLQIESVNEKADRATEQGHNTQTKLDEFFSYVQKDVMGAFAMQEKKMTNLEQSIKDLSVTVQALQKTIELKVSEPKSNQLLAMPAAFHAPNAAPAQFPIPAHRSQPSLAGYYGTVSETGREAPPPLPHIQDYRNSCTIEPHNDPCVGYGAGYGQHWGPRASYHSRNNKEERPYSGTSPYNFANGTGNYGNYYNGGYSSYAIPSSTPEQHASVNQGSTK